jgi:ankyrin repeat protein
MPSRKRGRKSRKPPTDPQLSSSKPSSAITPTGADRQDLSELVASGAGLDTKLGQLALQSRLDVTQAHIVVSDLGRKGHTYQRPTVKGHARAHFGDVYNVNQSSAHVPADSGGSDLMGALSFDGMSDRLTSVTPAYAETCRWVLDRPEYLRWRDPEQRYSHHGVLWIKGKAGTGKSTLMSSLYDHDRQNDCGERTVSFFFNARSFDTLAKSTEGMYRSLLYQILHQLPRLKDTLSHVQRPRPKEETWPIERLEYAFRTVVLSLSTDEGLTCFVDALDECNMKDVRRAIEHFENLAESVASQSIQFRICFSSRYYPQVTMRHHEELRLDLQPGHMQDISRYIDNNLTVRKVVKQELSTKIYDRCSGIFLWVVLVVKRLREASDTGSTRSKLLAILDSIPEELEDLFAKVVAEPDAALISLVQWTLFSKRWLSISEMYFAVQTSMGGTTTSFWNVDEIDEESMVRYLLHASRGLVESRHIGSTHSILFIHESAREYFLCGGLASMERIPPNKTDAVGHAKLAEGCLSYLELAINHPDFPTLRKLGDWSITPVPEVGRLPFMEYASEHFLRHTEVAFAGDIVDLDLLERFPLHTAVTFLHRTLRPMYLRLNPRHSTTLLVLLLERDCSELARALLERTSRPLPPCTQAPCDNSDASCTHARFTKPNLREECNGLYPNMLHLAIGLGREDFVELLLYYGADVDMADDLTTDTQPPGGRWGSPLSFAVAGDSHGIVRILLQHGARVDTAETRNILHVAARNSRKEVVQNLLERVDVNVADESSRTALHLTVERQPFASDYDATIAEILISAGANMEASDRDGNTVLIKAAGNSRIHLVRALLEDGANVHARNDYSVTALHAAVEGHLTCQFRDSGWHDQDLLPMLEALLDAGADINADGGYYDTVLDFACVDWNIELVRFLLDRGAVFTRRGRQHDDHIAELLSMVSRQDGKRIWERQRWSPVSDT